MFRNKPPAPAPAVAVASTGCSSHCFSLPRRGPQQQPRRSDDGGGGAEAAERLHLLKEQVDRLRLQLLEEEVERLSKLLLLDHGDEKEMPPVLRRLEDGG